MRRLLLDLIIFFSIIFLPYWFYIPLLVASIVVMPFFWEAVFLGFFIDMLYGLNVFFSIYALSALVLVALALVFKERLRFNV